MATTTSRKGRKPRSKGPASDFEALSDSEKDRIYDEIDAEAETLAERATVLTPRQRKAWAKASKRIGRPRLGKHGTASVSITVEKALLKQVNAYAKANGMKRSELFSLGVRAVLEHVR